MENELKFKDFTDAELIGKKVVISGGVYKINRFTAKYFGVEGSSDLFDKNTGRERGGSTWHTKYARLVTDEYAYKLNFSNKQHKERRRMIDEIKKVINPYDSNATHAQLTEIIKILKLEDKIN